MYYQESSSSSRKFSCDVDRCIPRCCCYSCCREGVLNDHTYGILKQVCKKIFKDLIRNKCQEKYAVFPGGNGIFEFDKSLNVKNPCDCGCYANGGNGIEDNNKQKKQGDKGGGDKGGGGKGGGDKGGGDKGGGDKGGGDNDGKGGKGKKKRKSFSSAAAVPMRPSKSDAKSKDGKDSKKLGGKDQGKGKDDRKGIKDEDKEKGGERPSKSNINGKDGNGDDDTDIKNGDKSKGLSESRNGSCIGRKKRKKRRSKRRYSAKCQLPDRFEETGVSHLLRIELENRDLCRCIRNCCNSSRCCCQTRFM